jgi:hypothetical protein
LRAWGIIRSFRTRKVGRIRRCNCWGTRKIHRFRKNDLNVTTGRNLVIYCVVYGSSCLLCIGNWARRLNGLARSRCYTSFSSCKTWIKSTIIKLISYSGCTSCHILLCLNIELPRGLYRNSIFWACDSQTQLGSCCNISCIRISDSVACLRPTVYWSSTLVIVVWCISGNLSWQQRTIKTSYLWCSTVRHYSRKNDKYYSSWGSTLNFR